MFDSLKAAAANVSTPVASAKEVEPAMDNEILSEASTTFLVGNNWAFFTALVDVSLAYLLALANTQPLADSEIPY